MTSKKYVPFPWLLAPKWKDFPMTKGLGHHRVPVGIILAGDEELIVSSTSQELNYLQIRLLNNDSKKEARFEIENPRQLSSLSTGAVSVPFVDGQYLDNVPSENITIRVQYPSNSKVLPIFHHDDDEDAFFELWDSEEAEFAYVESDYFGLLIPEGDKEHARALPNGKRLKDLINFFDEIFTIYSRLIGLSFEGTETNENIRNRFFLKADKSGPSPGYANYSPFWTAECTESVKTFWMNMNSTNWGALHEIAHGHELKRISDESFDTLEVWNNILVVFYQHIMMHDEMYTKGGLNRPNVNFDAELAAGVPVLNWGTFQKLNFLIHMFKKAGQQSFIRFNQLIRQELAGKPFYASGGNTLEKLMLLFSADFGLDVYPFMKLAKALISVSKSLEHYYSFSEVAYPLSYLISDQTLLSSTKTKLRLFYNTSLVTPLDLRVTNLKGDFTLEIDDSIFRSLFGEIFKLMDGTRTILERKILEQKILIKNIPIGVYKVFIPSTTRNYKLIYDDVYAVVHASTPKTLTLSAKTMEASSLLDVKILFLGLGSERVASLSLDFVKHVVKFSVFTPVSHEYYQDRLYASIKITNIENAVVLSVDLKGVGNVLKVYETPLQDTLQIEIFHAETKALLQTEDPLMDGLINHESNTNVLSVGKLGFQNNETLQTSLASSFLKQIDDAANRIRSKPFLFRRPYCSSKYDLFLAIKAFKNLFKDHALSSQLDDKYKDCLHPDFSIIDFADNLADQI